MYMNIANNPVLADPKHASNLPVSWYTLYILHTIPRAELEQMITDGRVHAGLLRKEAEVLHNREQSRARRADRDDLEGEVKEKYLDPVSDEPSYFPTRPKKPESAVQTIFQMHRLLGDLIAVKTEVRKNSDLKKQVRALGDQLLGIAGDDPDAALQPQKGNFGRGFKADV